MPRILVAGESVESFSKRPGGAPANVSVGLARLDAAPAFWTRVGADPFGDFLVDALRDNGVPTDLVERDPDAKTSLAFVSLGEDAEREFSFYRDGTADTRMEPGTLADETFAEIDWLHVGGVTLADEPSRSATFDTMRRAGEAGATVSFDPNARPELWTDFSFADSMREAFALADVVKVAPEDLSGMNLSGDGGAATISREVCDLGPHTALVTLGGEGAYGYATADAPWGETEAEHGGYEVDPVDTTGAGDAFTAGVVTALSSGESLSEALAFANAVAALTTTAEGAMTALPDREAVAAFRGEE
jgi:fructokinase